MSPGSSASLPCHLEGLGLAAKPTFALVRDDGMTAQDSPEGLLTESCAGYPRRGAAFYAPGLPLLKIAVPNPKVVRVSAGRQSLGDCRDSYSHYVSYPPSMSCILREKIGKLLTPNLAALSVGAGDNRGGLQHVRLQLAQRKVTSCQGWR
jgi:hypothetical protein